MTGRFDSNGKVEAVIIRRLSNTSNLRFNAGFLNSDTNYANVSLDLNIDSKNYLYYFRKIIFKFYKLYF